MHLKVSEGKGAVSQGKKMETEEQSDSPSIARVS